MRKKSIKEIEEAIIRDRQFRSVIKDIEQLAEEADGLAEEHGWAFFIEAAACLSVAADDLRRIRKGKKIGRRFVSLRDL